MGEHQQDRPLVLLVHGFPEYWWAWRDHIPAIAQAGFEVAAIDTRGVGGSDKTPDIVDVPTLAEDIPAIARALGASSVVPIGVGRGGGLAWTSAALNPDMVRGVLTFSAPHPKALSFGRTRRNSTMWRDIIATYMRPLARKGLGEEKHIERIISQWSAPGNDGAKSQAKLYAEALRLPFAADSSIEQLRWSYMTARHVTGWRYMRIVRTPLHMPIWTVRGELDPLLSEDAWVEDTRYARADYRHITIDGAGHFVPEEQTAESTRIILEFLEQFN
ncbi:MAG: alpha/beta hydrolase [Actinomycetaceae bacterium]|nr:alpha/beta hydrolase [Actinomycetaceae bacterium]